MNIYVGNLADDVTEDDLRKAFEPFGQVDGARLIKDRRTGLTKGFGFVAMPKDAEAQAAITGLNDKELKGQTIVVSEARPRERRGSGRPGGQGGQRF
jgi:RNA recognition motif-containing protein